MPEVSALAVRELTLPADPLDWFEILRVGSHPWLLDSGAASGPLARFSFMGADPYLVLRSRDGRNVFECRRAVSPELTLGSRVVDGHPLDVAEAARPRIANLEVVIDAFEEPLPFLAGAVGYLGYELAQVCEPITLRARDELELPDLVMLYNDRMLAIDHQAQRAYALGLGFARDNQHDLATSRANQVASEIEALVGGGPSAASGRHAARVERRRMLDRTLPESARSSFDAFHYRQAVEAIRDEIAAGNVFQANLTQRIDLPRAVGPKDSDAEIGWRLYRTLRRISPAPFSAYLALDDVTVVSNSPERFLRVDRDGTVESRPIKGTRRRGTSREEDILLQKDLEGSPKDRAENLMIVDLVRNDLGRVCETGSVRVLDLMAIESYATVFQMVSTVCGRLREDCDVADLLRATFPPGSMTGAPKIAAMEIIDRIEPVRRGIYSGAIGYLDAGGGLDLSVVIRTLLVRNGQVHLHSGGAVVSDSDPEAEYRESLDKIRALLAAVEHAG